MTSKPNPFGIYDFLGYFIPGAFAIYSFIFIEYYISQGNIDYAGIKDLLNFQSAELYIPFILFSYILGHFLSFLSSISIEKYSIWKYSYPSKYLLKIKHDGFWGAKKKKTQKLWRIVIVIFIFPIFLFDLTIASIFKLKRIYTRELDEFLTQLIKEEKDSLISTFGINLGEYENIQDIDFYRVISHYTYEYSSKHQSRLYNYVALYGFARTISLVIILTIWTVIVLNFASHGFGSVNVYLLIAILSFLAYVFFMIFMKFYRRYTLEGYMIMLVLKGNNLHSNQ